MASLVLVTSSTAVLGHLIQYFTVLPDSYDEERHAIEAYLKKHVGLRGGREVRANINVTLHTNLLESMSDMRDH
ncbi:hypothetical protein C2E23DRAFT_465229 [Lenzites betulinus]|nr:hypothetical protein C2E23DRAFT_465229 [Lenzites betulinus]